MLTLASINSFAAYDAWRLRSAPERNVQRRYEMELLRRSQTSFTVAGSCHTCKAPSEFLVDLQYSYLVIDGQSIPNWRERCVCLRCNLNNRVRASMHVLEEAFPLTRSASIYVTEAVTAQYKWMRQQYPNTVGSEFMGEAFRGGTMIDGIRHEDLTRLSFPDQSFDAVLSFDVLEHIPNYRAAFAEICRSLRPGGILLFSVPFSVDNARNTVRARVLEDGRIEHLLPPEYHGDPVKQGEGCLAFYQFGWDLLGELTEIGFETAGSYFYWSSEFCYLGDQQLVLYAKKGPAKASLK